MTDIYLDNSATTRVLPKVAEAMVKVMVTDYGNPSSLHGKGVAAERLLQKSRERIGNLLGVSPGEIFFTSGGTEGNNWAIISAARQKQGRGKHIITSQIEHASVLAPCQWLEQQGFKVTYLPVNEAGLISHWDLESALTDETVLVSIMAVNNEVGTIQPIQKLGTLIKKMIPQALFHVDGVQAFGKIPLDIHQGDIDMLTISAHKLHGPKGVGVLYMKKDITIPSFIMGGEQERKLRAGTENVPGIVGFGVAVEEARKRLKNDDGMKELGTRLRAGLMNMPGCHFNGTVENLVSHITNVWFEGVDRGEVLVHMLEERGLYVSTGSACHSRRNDPSHVLKAMGKEKEALYGAIRLSLSPFNTGTEIEDAITIITEAVGAYRDFRGGL